MVSLYNSQNFIQREMMRKKRQSNGKGKGKEWYGWMSLVGFFNASFSCEGLHQNHVRWLWDF